MAKTMTVKTKRKTTKVKTVTRKWKTMTVKMVKAKRNKYMKLWQKQLPSCETRTFLGKGGFGSVYLIRRKPSQTDAFPVEMAVKTAKVVDSVSLKYEKRLLSKLTASPYVIRCYGDEEIEEFDEYSGVKSGERIYNLFLEFCSGGSLSDHIRKSAHGLLPCQVRSYTRDIVQGLVYVHSQGIVHCDVKPDNILLVPQSSHGFVAKLADFGLAKNQLVEDEASPYIRGTWRYMSPELVRDKVLTYSTDIWALGCVVVEMMNGEPPWGHGLGKEELLNSIGYTSQVPQIPSNISENAKDFVSLCFNRCNISRKRAAELLKHPFLVEDD